MGKDYDKIIKENITSIFLPLSENFFGIKIIKSKDLPEKLQTTHEREPDFIKKIWTDKKETFILHIEFQTSDEKEMVYRMAEYKAILQRKFKLPVKQFVIYLGTRKPKMKTELNADEVIKGFQLTNIREMDAYRVLESEIPEEIMLAILGNYGEHETEQIINKIIDRLQQFTTDQIVLQRYFQQLLVLSRLRKLEVQTKKQIEGMPITYNIKTDGLYKEGIKDGKREGKIEGIKEGKKETIIEMLKDPSMSEEKIAKFTKTSLAFVRKIREEMRKN